MALSIRRKRDMQVYAIMAVTMTTTPLLSVKVGKIIDEGTMVVSTVEGGYPVSGVQVEVTSIDSKKSSQWITNAKGYAVAHKASPESEDYGIKLKSGNYEVKVTKSGYLTNTAKVFLAEDDFVEKIVPLDPSNHRPVAEPGPVQYGNPGKPVKLDSTKSTDADAAEDDPTYGIASVEWELVGAPTNSKANLAQKNFRKQKFIPDLKGEYNLTLTVSDGELEQVKEHRILVDTPYAEKTPIPIAIGGHKVASIKSQVYLTGGWNKTFSNRVFLYDLDKNEWSEGEPLQYARNHHTMAVLNGAIYVIGGHNAQMEGGIEHTEVYNPHINKWARGVPLPTPRYSLASVVVKGKIYTFGGLGGPTKVEIFDSAEEVWTQGPPMPRGRYRHAAEVVGEKIYLIGGKGTETLVDIFDTTKNEWSEGPPMPTGRYYLDSVVINDHIMVIGGHGIGERAGEAKVETFDPKTGIWDPKNPMPFPLDIHASVVYEDKVYIFGGEKEFGASAAVNNTFVYDPRFDIYKTLLIKDEAVPEDPFLR